MDADHQQYQLRHYIEFERFDITTTLYRNEFARDWYKSQSVEVAGAKEGIGDALESASHLAALRGELDLDGSADNNITLRTNNREYYSTGIQSDVATSFLTGDVSHDLELGARLHYDQEDRFQREDAYSITNGIMQLASTGAPGSNANREADARAIAFYVQDEINYDAWTFVPGFRYEHIKLERTDFNSGSYRENTVKAFVPGLGIGYEINPSISLFGGVHKGFAPPSPGSTNDDEEESINYEIGTRYNQGLFSAEVAGFFHDYSNLLGECTLSSGCTAPMGTQFNAGEVDTYGIEAMLSYNAAEALGLKHISVPLHFTYTYTNAEFKNSFVSAFDEWGNVTSGDELPYIPEHQFYIGAGLVADQWELHAGAKYLLKCKK